MGRGMTECTGTGNWHHWQAFVVVLAEPRFYYASVAWLFLLIPVSAPQLEAAAGEHSLEVLQ